MNIIKEANTIVNKPELVKIDEKEVIDYQPSLDNFITNTVKNPINVNVHNMIIDCYFSVINFLQDNFVIRWKEEKALRDIQQNNIIAENLKIQKTVRAYKKGFHDFNHTPTYFARNRENNLVRESVRLVKNRNIQKHFNNASTTENQTTI
jgi:hypothetical protein